MSETDQLFARLRVLIVEDSAHMRQLLSAMLQALGVKDIIIAKCGDEGLEKLHSHTPDIVLTDAAMEPTDGFAFVERLRHLDSQVQSSLPVIMISGHRERELIERARDVGVTEYLAKPVTAVGLYSRLIEAAANPRPFIKTENFLGPDRRRRDQKYDGPDRRGATPPAETARWEL
ncbi:MAG: CheY-like chemotaxis protein [Parvibaculaceae bacterium]